MALSVITDAFPTQTDEFGEDVPIEVLKNPVGRSYNIVQIVAASLTLGDPR